VSQTVIVVLVVLSALAAAVLSLLLTYLVNLYTLRRREGRGSGAIAGTLSEAFNPRSAHGRSSAAPTESLYCPRCQAPRQFYEGFCTTCGLELIQALIAEAKREDQP
jgi:hypothetical protein